MSEAFRLLGRFQLRIGGRFQDWGQPRLRAILGTLLVHAGRPLTFRALIEWAWPEDIEPPLDATFHTYAKRIRTVLRTVDAPARLVVRGGNIRLDVDRELIDYYQARTLIDRARAAARDNDHHKARELAAAAVRLWVGPPLSEVDTARAAQWRQTVVDNVWLPANTLLIGEYLGLGELDEAMARLDELQEEHPNSLGLAKRRIEVLRRLGRYTDATTYYLALRRRMMADEDSEAAEELRRFHNQFRETTAATGDVRTLTRTAEPRAVPVQLPHAIPDIAGRDTILREIDTAATTESGQLQSAIIGLEGLPGVGKTSLAVHWARRRHERHGDGALFVDLHGFDKGPAAEPPRVVDDLLYALAFPVDRIAGYAGRTAKLRELLAHRRLVIVLDNARDSAQVRPLLPLLSTCLVVVTSRRRLTALSTEYGARSFPVEPLRHRDATRFLAGRIGDRAVRDPRSVAALAELCGGLPLTLHLVAHQVAPQPGIRLTDFVDHLRDSATMLNLGGDGDSPTTTPEAAFASSYQALPESEQRLFRLLSLHPGPDISLPAAAALAASRPRRPPVGSTSSSARTSSSTAAHWTATAATTSSGPTRSASRRSTTRNAPPPNNAC
ncbi:MAG TPA: BTAD domain-containing putative transcriptional regulator [Pseudonocardiaceae bacterium]|nr:BTAD domain-containing putative transcriptional regulator [Pseudonocardiaceae bacterium]